MLFRPAVVGENIKTAVVLPRFKKMKVVVATGPTPVARRSCLPKTDGDCPVISQQDFV